MKKILSITALCLACVSLFAQHPQGATAQDSTAFASASWKVVQAGKGAYSKTAQIDMFGDTEFISVFSYPMKKFKTRIVNVPPQGEITSEIGKQNKAVASLNASYFDVKKLISSCYLRLDGKFVHGTYQNEFFRVNGMIAIDGKKVRVEYLDTTVRSKNVIASGPVLVKDGQRVSYDELVAGWDVTNKKERGKSTFYTLQHPRTMMGIDKDEDRVVFIVIDGRFPGQGKGATITQCAAVCSWLGLEDAINLDGGGSSTIWVDGQGVLNHPYDNKKFDHEGERKVPTALIAK